MRKGLERRNRGKSEQQENEGRHLEGHAGNQDKE